MSVAPLIARGVGFSPGSVKFMPTLGLGVGAAVPTISIVPSSVHASQTGVSIAVTGVNTLWLSVAPVFAFSGVAGLSITSTVVVDDTHATLTIDTGAATGTATLTETVQGESTPLTVTLLRGVKIGGSADQPPSQAPAVAIPWPFRGAWDKRKDPEKPKPLPRLPEIPEPKREPFGVTVPASVGLRATCGGAVASGIVATREESAAGFGAAAASGGSVKVRSRWAELRKADEELIREML